MEAYQQIIMGFRLPSVRLCLWLGILFTGPQEPTAASVTTGEARIEGRGFFSSPSYSGQKQHAYTVTVEGHYRKRHEEYLLFTFVPHLRVDDGYDNALQFDIRELNLMYREGPWSIRAGIGQVRWGASDVFSPIDIINQTDRIDIGEETEKLGQPMIEFSLAPGVGILNLYLLPYFREQTFPGKRGRLRPRLAIDMDHAVYETGNATKTLDLAARYSHTIGNLDYGLHLFFGRGRTPYLIPSDQLPEILQTPEIDGGERWVPVYENIMQTGLDAQWALHGWLWKLEAMYREGYVERFYAGIGGFEYAFPTATASGLDIRLIAEYAYDQRGKSMTSQTLFDNDLFLGFRLLTGDFAGTSLRGGLIYDLDHGEHVTTIRVSRRIGARNRVSADGWFLGRSPEDSLLYELRRDHFVRLQWVRYFP